jgi:predicted RNA-binding Zn-ribbon protein involved in translation (DUF1610 family)
MRERFAAVLTSGAGERSTPKNSPENGTPKVLERHMSMQEKIFKLLDFNQIGFQCGDCQTLLIFNTDKFRFNSNQCPNCGIPLKGLVDVATGWQRLRTMTEDNKLTVYLQTEQPSVK